MEMSFYKGKRVFVTGHTGFKGTWLCKILLMAGAEVKGYALSPTDDKNIFSMLKIDKNMESIYADIRDGENLKKELVQFQPEIVFHLAAQPLVRESYSDPVNTFEINIMGTVNILEAIRICPSVKSVVNVTTDKVYQNKEWYWGYREDEYLAGLDPYSNSKSCSELVTYSYNNSFFYSDSAPAISTARSGNVIGGGDFSKDRIIPDCIRAGESNKPIVVRNPLSTRPYQHVLECLSGYLLLAKKQYENKSKFSGCYNFGPDEINCVTTEELVNLFCDSWGNGLSWINEYDGGPHEANFLKLDCSKAKSVLKWTPKWSVKEAVDKTVIWAKVDNTDFKEVISRTEQQISEFFDLNTTEKVG